MDNFWEFKGKLEAMPGCSIDPTVKEGIQIAAAQATPLSFDFNGVNITVEGNSDPVLILRDWQRALNGYIDKNIGPYPALTLTNAEREHDSEVEATNQARRDASQTEYDRKAAIKLAATTARLANVTPIELCDAESWRAFDENNRDPYGHGVFVYAEQWARLMQLELSRGAKLADIADACSHDADTEGITGFMYGCAVGALAKCWKHGEELRRWHNLKTQIRNEGEKANESGGVLNPALLNIG